MDKNISKTIRIIHLVYLICWLMPVIFIFIGYTSIIQFDSISNDSVSTYFLEVAEVGATILLIPLALKMMPWLLKTKIDHLGIEKAIESYKIYSILQLVLISIPIILGMVIYVLTKGNIGIFCHLIGVTSLLFCIPSEKRMRQDLHIM